MHEVGIMNDALEIAAEAARDSGVSKINRVRMKVGELSGVVPDALAFAFDVVSQGTIADGAKLVIETVPVSTACVDCGNQRPGRGTAPCPICCGTSLITHGYELVVSSIEVD